MSSFHDFTVVVGVDRKHLRQLSIVLPTWKKHKPSLFNYPWIVFFDNCELALKTVANIVRPHVSDVRLISWPASGITYKRTTNDRFGDPQRHKMLAGFVHVPAMTVATEYWLKLDTDVVATGNDQWIDSKWFKGKPAIISHRWTYTKPPNQIDILDDWVFQYRKNIPVLSILPPLNMHPKPGATRLGHLRVISWCGFFNSTITKFASNVAETLCGQGQLPVPSQDGYLWYVAKRLQHEVRPVNMKHLGWQQWHTDKNIQIHAQKALNG